MAVGLAAGMGYLGIAVLLVVVLGAVSMILTITSFGDQRNRKDLRITIPESLNYTDVFDDILKSYAKNWELVQVKTTNMGSLYKLTYQIEMKDTSEEKKMIDELRCCNGNLEISCMTSSFGKEEL